MRTDPRALHGTDCDLLVVGAGAIGAAIARDAALRGLAVVLCDAGDVAADAGLRTEHLWWGAAPAVGEVASAARRELAADRELLLRQAPHLVRPLPVLVPCHGDGERALPGPSVRRSTLPRPRELTPTEAAAAFPGLRTRGLRSARIEFAAAVSVPRLILGSTLAAAAAGARIVTHCRLASLAARGATLVDALSSAEVTVRARRVVNAGGTAVDHVRRQLGLGDDDLATIHRSADLVLAPRAGELALLVRRPAGGAAVVLPGSAGTFGGLDGANGEFGTGELVAALGEVLDPAPSAGDVLWSFSTTHAVPRARFAAGGPVVVDERLPAGELHSVLGEGLAAPRAFAERAVARWFGAAAPSPTRTTCLPGGDGPREVTDPLWWRHGSRAGSIRAIAAQDPTAARALCPHRPFLAAEAVAALRHDGAVTFADLLLRRLVHDLGPCLEPDCLRAAHAWFVRARRWPVDDDPAAAAAAVRSQLDLAGAATGSSPTARS